jgi:alkanesulfonate monooxygenase SsuD/methylene tetrahydromethanopterin reductase-like flavin-dependent oxidoreductase (luciferase family)
VFVAETRDEAERIALPARISMVSLRTGRPRTLPTLEEAAAYPWTDAERQLLAQLPSQPSIGTPDQVRDELADLVDRTQANELMVTTMTHGLAERLTSFALLAKVWGLT